MNFYGGSQLQNQGTMTLGDNANLTDADGNANNNLLNDSGATVTFAGSTSDQSATVGVTATNNGTVSSTSGALNIQTLTNLTVDGVLTGGTYTASGGTLAEIPATYELASPIAHVASDSPPFLFVNGEDDRFVSASQSVAMRDALDAAGVETRLLLVPGGGHLWNRGSDADDWEIPLTSIDTPESQAAIVDFLDHTIGPPP